MAKHTTTSPAYLPARTLGLFSGIFIGGPLSSLAQPRTLRRLPEITDRFKESWTQDVIYPPPSNAPDLTFRDVFTSVFTEYYDSTYPAGNLLATSCAIANLFSEDKTVGLAWVGVNILSGIYEGIRYFRNK